MPHRPRMAGSMKTRIIALLVFVVMLDLERCNCQVYNTTTSASFEGSIGMKSVISHLLLPLSDSSHLPSPTTSVLLRTSSSTVLTSSPSPTTAATSSSPVLSSSPSPVLTSSPSPLVARSPSPTTSVLARPPNPTTSLLTSFPSPTSSVAANSTTSLLTSFPSPTSSVAANSTTSLGFPSPTSSVAASSTTSLLTSFPSPTSSVAASSPSPTTVVLARSPSPTTVVLARSPSPTTVVLARSPSPALPNTSVLTRPSTSVLSESPSYSTTSVLTRFSSATVVSLPKLTTTTTTTTTSTVVGRTTRDMGLFSATPYPTASVVAEQQCAMELEELQYLRGWVYGLAVIAILFLVLSLVLAFCLAVVICKRRGHYTVRHEASSEVNKYWTSPSAAEADELEMKYKPPTKIENQNVLDVMVLNDETDLTDLQTFQKPKVSVTEQPDPDALKGSPHPQNSVGQGEAAQKNSKPPRPAVRPKPLRKKQLEQRNSDPYALPFPQPVSVPSPQLGQEAADPHSYQMLDPGTMQSQRYTPLVKRGESLPIMRNVGPVVVPRQKY